MIKAVLSVVVLVAAIQAQQPNNQTTEQEHAAMMKRGDAGMGFSQDKTTHHFILRKDGGVIQVSANDANDDASKDHIRMHLSHVAKMFSIIPMFIHDTTPPGVPMMERLHNGIHYEYQPTGAGGQILIETSNKAAVKAVHNFLRFQITEHHTGDPSQVANDK